MLVAYMQRDINRPSVAFAQVALFSTRKLVASAGTDRRFAL